MNELEYSVEAKNVLSKFHGVEKILYVEGDDDALFWETVFEKLASFSVKVEDVGGKEKLLKYAEEILNGEAEYLIAMDSDYDMLTGRYEGSQFIYTYGYSIENSIITADSIRSVYRNVGRLSRRGIPEDFPQSWLDQLSSRVEKLLMADIINRQDNLGLEVIPDKCDRFMASSKSVEICEVKVNRYLDSVFEGLEDHRYKKCQELIESKDCSTLDLLRGHFLFSVSSRFLRTKLRAQRSITSFSNDAIFGNLMTAFGACFGDEHPHYEYYSDQISAVQL